MMKHFYPFAKQRRKVAKTISNRLMLLFLFCGLFVVSAHAKTIYVNASASAGGDGNSWTTAYNNLQSALDVAVSGDKIYVAAGTYKPSVDPEGTSTTRKQTFLLRSGVALYGGYNATTGTRDVKANKAILSGDLLGDDLPGFSNISDNVYHVVLAQNLTAATVLDGFIITGGNASEFGWVLGDFSTGWGAAIGVAYSGTNMTVNNCVISENTGFYAALDIRSSSPNVTNCVFAGNRGQYGYAAAIGSESSLFLNCLFVDNTAGNEGGAIGNSSGETRIVNCTFYRNSTGPSSEGGTIFNDNGSTPKIINSIIWGNTGPAGKEGIVNGGSTPGNPTVNYSNIQGGYAGTGNINVNPLFVNTSDLDGTDNTWGTADDGLHLENTSPSANTGNDGDAAGITNDIIGSDRIQNTTINMGAYETLITKTAQTISFTAIGTKIYGDDPFTISATASSGLPITSYSIVSGPATISGNTVTITGAGSVVVKAVQSGDATYTSAEETYTLTIDKRAITVTANTVGKEYGTLDPMLSYAVTGSLVGSDAFSGGLQRDPGEDAGTYPINQGSLMLSSNYILSFVTNNFTIEKRSITVTAEIATKVYGDTDPALTHKVTAGTLFGSDVLSGDLTRDAGENVGAYAIRKGSVGNPNYSITFVSKNLTITQKPITITANAATKVYGETDPAFTYAVTSGALLGSDAFTGNLSRVTGEDVGIYAITLGDLNNSNYNITFVDAGLSITKAALTITAENKTKVEGAANPTLTVSYSGFKNGETAAALTTAPAVSTTATASSPAGTYPITVSGAASANYAITYVNGTLTVTACPTPVITATGNVLSSSSATGNQWFLEGVEIPGATGQTHRVQANGLYTVRVTAGGCTATSVAYNFVATRVDNPGALSGQVVVYPNPVTNGILSFDNQTGHKLQVQLYSLNGVKVKELTVVGTKGSLQVDDLANGHYQVRITDTQKNLTISQSIIKL